MIQDMGRWKPNLGEFNSYFLNILLAAQLGSIQQGRVLLKDANSRRKRQWGPSWNLATMSSLKISIDSLGVETNGREEGERRG
jgi:hypothetical protein